jgi:bacterioferritin-associated ferredoxin
MPVVGGRGRPFLRSDRGGPVIVCHCRRVSDATVEATITAGADTVLEVADRCHAGSRCGSCWSTIEALIDELAPRPATTVAA